MTGQGDLERSYPTISHKMRPGQVPPARAEKANSDLSTGRSDPDPMFTRPGSPKSQRVRAATQFDKELMKLKERAFDEKYNYK
jgi:hypothetical protein